MEFDQRLREYFVNAVLDRRRVDGMTHDFYRYPARFSPAFVRAVVEMFSSTGDIVLDPFAGGGTTLVEAAALGRRPVGCDVNPLGVFVSRVKTTPLSDAEMCEILEWAEGLPEMTGRANSGVSSELRSGICSVGDLDDEDATRIARFLEALLAHVATLPSRLQQDFARCALLRTGQWALDCRRDIPTVDQFRKRLLIQLERMLGGMRQYREALQKHYRPTDADRGQVAVCLNRSAIGIECDERIRRLPKPRLVLTSPPYPGVHILYNRWQIRGRKETAAPFWLVDCLDSQGESYYTFGSRRQKGLPDYFRQLEAAFTSISQVAAPNTMLVQMIAFSDPSWQVDRYLATLLRAGFREVKFPSLTNSPDGRIWRWVPNRKWYAAKTPANASSYEVVLFHQVNT